MAYSLMLKRSRTNGTHPKTSSRMGDNNEGRSESKAKIPTQQYYEKYMTLASESIATGDRIAAEGYYQHAEHYLRVMNELKQAAPKIESVEARGLSSQAELVQQLEQKA